MARIEFGKYLAVDTRICGGRLILRGTRILVADVVSLCGDLELLRSLAASSREATPARTAEEIGRMNDEIIRALRNRRPTDDHPQ